MHLQFGEVQTRWESVRESILKWRWGVRIGRRERFRALALIPCQNRGYLVLTTNLVNREILLIELQLTRRPLPIYIQETKTKNKY